MALNDGPCTRGRSRQVQPVLKYSPFILALIPPLYLMTIVVTQTVDVPFADQWALVPLLAHAYQGTLSFQDLWAQHNEHRLLFPRLLMLGLAFLSRWNTQDEMLANIGLATAIFSLLVYQVRRTARTLQMKWARLVPILSLAVFSLNQAENWWGGWNIQIFLNTLAITASIVLLTRPAKSWPAFVLALVCGIVATYSYSTGLLVWWLGIVLLLLHAGRWTTRDGLRIGAWGIAGALTTTSFLYQYRWTAQTPALTDLLGNPLRYLTYTVIYLGAAPTRGAVEYLFGLITGDVRAICNLGESELCTYVNNSALGVGISGATLFLCATWMLRRSVGMQLVLPYLGLGLYALSTGILTSFGRASYGNHQALAQRYATSATLFWLALVILLSIIAHIYTERWLAGVSTAVILAFVLLTTLSTLQGPKHFRWQQEFLTPARNELFRLQNDALLQRLYFDPRVVKQDVAFLRQYHLSVFR
jgi:hypothetical protein